MARSSSNVTAAMAGAHGVSTGSGVFEAVATKPMSA